MDLTINNQACNIPYYLPSITLGKFLEFHEKYGLLLQKMLIGIMNRKYVDEIDRLVAFEDYIDQEALSWGSFWSGFDLFEVRNEDFMKPLYEMHRKLSHLLDETEDYLPIDSEKEWNGETWVISDYQASAKKVLNKDQMIDFLRTILFCKYNLKNYKHQYFLNLCAIYFRKKDEPFSEVIGYPSFNLNGDKITLHEYLVKQERIELIKELPLNIAFSIKEILPGTIDEVDHLNKEIRFHFSEN